MTAIYLYWLLGSSVREKDTSRTIYPSFIACKRRKARIKLGVVNSFSCSHDNLRGRRNVFYESCSYAYPTVEGFLLGCAHHRFVRWTKPLTSSLLLGSLADLSRSKSQLIAENALLRKPLIILSRQVKRPVYRKADRVLLVLLARVVQTWKHALIVIQPDTLLRWHRELFRLVWKRRSKAASHTPKIAAETVALINEMAGNNRLWGAERIRGELLKLGIQVGKRTI